VVIVLAASLPGVAAPTASAASPTSPTSIPPGASPTSRAGGVRRFGAEIGEGLRWLFRHRVLRALTITVALSNLGLGAVLSILVLIARDRLGIGAYGYGLLLVISAVGGIVGGLLVGRLVDAVGAGTVLRAGLVLEAFVHAGMALTPNAVVAGALMFLLGLHLAAFSAIGASLRQSLAPAGLLGRLQGSYRMVSNTGMLLGAALGGIVSRYLGLGAPFWIGLIFVTAVTVGVWRALSDHEIAAARLSHARTDQG
jgi:predicted MFS family arabinose efflux permease